MEAQIAALNGAGCDRIFTEKVSGAGGRVLPELECELIAEKTRAGLEAARKRGRVGGGPGWTGRRWSGP